VTAARAAAVLAVDRPPGATPYGIGPEALRLAMVEDVYEVLAGLELVDAVVALSPAPQPGVLSVVWPGTHIVAVRAVGRDSTRRDVGGDPDEGAAAVCEVLDALLALSYAEGAVVAADAPDLPGLMVGKLWRALGRADVAVCPAVGGGLVALAARLPVAPWLSTSGVGLDTADAVERLRDKAPANRAVAIGPGWHRLRSPGDLSLLDPGLEGWDSTRALLSGRGGNG